MKAYYIVLKYEEGRGRLGNLFFPGRGQVRLGSFDYVETDPHSLERWGKES